MKNKHTATVALMSPTKPGTLLQRLHLATRRAREAGMPLPPEPVLAASLGVSRSQLREALSRLEGEGVIARKSKTGTIVNGAALDIQTWLTWQEPFIETLNRLNLNNPVIELMSLRFRIMNEEESEYFNQPSGTGLIDVRKRWRAEGVVHMVADYQVPAPTANDLGDVENPSAPVFELASRLSGAEVVWEIARARSEVADESLAIDLEVESGTPMFVLDLMGVSSDGTRMYRTVERHVRNAVEYGFVRSFR